MLPMFSEHASVSDITATPTGEISSSNRKPEVPDSKGTITAFQSKMFSHTEDT